MKLFLDTADIHAIEHWKKQGVIDGVTTNPSHLAHEQKDPTQLILAIAELMSPGLVSVQITQHDPHQAYIQAHELAKLAENIVVKIPADLIYYPVIKQLVREHIPLNITLIFSALQGMLMSSYGVRFISPFIGRLDDHDPQKLAGLRLMQELVALKHNGQYTTAILAASVRSVSKLHDVMMAGADVATIAPDVLEKAFEHPLTNEGLKKFSDDWCALQTPEFPAKT